ncbi:hypothetical protein ACIPSA_22870 [Streptomyces sp. NPDC086549]|uniref:hypothetical protein n=1 Tax=Streptomyces sp. NPDC086549 TaxID=3365752 RepID=UPI003811CB40
MSVRPARRTAACLFTVGALVMASGCLGSSLGRRARPASPASAAGQLSPSAAALTEAQARSALITQADMGGPWGPTAGAATWRDGWLKATTQTPECQRLLDALYADELLGQPSGTHAVTALDDGDDQAQLRYQVVGGRRADLDRTLDWLKALPQTCGQFTAATTSAGLQAVQVLGAELPPVGDARQGLRVTLTGQATTNDGQAAVLTLDVAVVRVGDDAIVLTDGALGTPPASTVRQALELGAQRLTQVHEQARAQA